MRLKNKCTQNQRQIETLSEGNKVAAVDRGKLEAKNRCVFDDL